MRTLPLFFLLLSSLLIPINCLSLDIDLIHRDSPLSPFYNSSSTLSELARNARLRSLLRYKHRLHQTKILPPIFIQGGGEYLMKIYVGSPPVETWAIADTGSDLIWVQCLPCNECYLQNTPIFNPFKSPTYKIESCHSKPCTLFSKGQSACGISTQCVYGYGYGDGSITTGEVARDSFSFGGKSASFHKSLLFGCGHNNTGIFSREGSGLVGLGNGPLSLASQLDSEIDHKFSYCLVPYFSKSTGKLKLGKGAKISGSKGVVSTPFITDSDKTNYYLTLEGITVGNKTVKTASHKRHGNTLIDSGATWFALELRFYTKIEALINKAITVKPEKNPPDPFTLCYSKKYSKSIKKNFPKFVVHFHGGDVTLNPDHNIFFPQHNSLCLAIIPIAKTKEFQFDYGNVPQVNFQVEYDLKAQKISFAPADCSKR